MYFTVEDWGGKSCSFTTGNNVTIIFSIFEGRELYFFSFFILFIVDLQVGRDAFYCGWMGCEESIHLFLEVTSL